MTDSKDYLMEFTVEVVSAFVGKSSIGAFELPGLIAAVHDTFKVLAQGVPVSEPAAPPIPAVSIRKSVQPDNITCLECGQKLKMLKRHIMTDHGMTPDDYRARWSLPAEYPMVAPNYTTKRSELAIKIGLGRGRRK